MADPSLVSVSIHFRDCNVASQIFRSTGAPLRLRQRRGQFLLRFLFRVVEKLRRYFFYDGSDFQSPSCGGFHQKFGQRRHYPTVPLSGFEKLIFSKSALSQQIQNKLIDRWPDRFHNVTSQRIPRSQIGMHRCKYQDRDQPLTPRFAILIPELNRGSSESRLPDYWRVALKD